MNAARLLVPLALLGLLSAAWLKGGWPALALAASGVVLWALLHCTRLLAVMRRAAARPLGYVDSAVMLNARLRPRLPLLHVVAMTGALVGHVQAVFIHEHGLVAQPVLPSLLAHAFPDALAQLARIGRKVQSLGLFAELDAVNHACHVQMPLSCSKKKRKKRRLYQAALAPNAQAELEARELKAGGQRANRRQRQKESGGASSAPLLSDTPIKRSI